MWSHWGCCSSSSLVAGVSSKDLTCNTLLEVVDDSFTVVVRVVVGITIGWLRAAGRVVSRAVVVSLNSAIVNTIKPLSGSQTLHT